MVCYGSVFSCSPFLYVYDDERVRRARLQFDVIVSSGFCVVFLFSGDVNVQSRCEIYCGH